MQAPDARLPTGWQSSSHSALKPINLTNSDVDNDVRNRDLPYSAPHPVTFLPVWKDEINQVFLVQSRQCNAETGVLLITCNRCMLLPPKPLPTIPNQHLPHIFQRPQQFQRNLSQRAPANSNYVLAELSKQLLIAKTF
jgi:hypothetical protein